MKCFINGCVNKVLASGLCNRHYHQSRRAKLPTKPCACGCGGQAIATFINGHNTRLFPSDEQSRRGQQNDGTALRDRGLGLSYRKVGQRHEHRTVAEQLLGRPLQPGEIVHHIDHNKRNNDPSNLQVMTQSEHARLHFKKHA